MPLPEEVYELLAEVGTVAGDYTLVGLFVNPVTGEMGTFASHPLEPGAVLGFLQNGTQTMLEAMKSGEMVSADEASRQTAETENGDVYVH